MEKKIKVYIASPYTKGDIAVNVKNQLDCADELMDLGFVPYTPLYSHFQHMAHPRPYQDWVDIDFIWVEVCDCLLRLPGESSGADNEIQLAEELGKPVFYNKTDLFQYYSIPDNTDMEPISKGLKFDEKKLRWDLLPIDCVEEVVKILTFGAEKYAPNNWQKIESDRYFAALMRHLSASRQGQLIDDESGLSHLSHAMCNVLFLLWKEKHGESKEN